MSALRAYASVRVSPDFTTISAGSFSTRPGVPIQLRDVDFVTRYRASCYLATGVETRTSVTCAPALPLSDSVTGLARAIVSRPL